MEDLAKPKGITLKDHVQHVVDEAKCVAMEHPFVLLKYERFTGVDLAKRLNGAAIYHDEGKKHSRWQTACQNDYLSHLKYERGEITWKERSNELLKTGIRHEIESLKMHLNAGFSEPVKVAIAAHHAKLGLKHESRWVQDKAGGQLWSSFKKLSQEECLKRNVQNTLLRSYEFNGVRSLLQLADHRASIVEDNRPVPLFIKFKYEFPSHYAQKRNVQKIVAQYWQDDLLLIRAPTGSGKTDAALLWASLQIEHERADRLVIAMPTRFTSNALAINVASSLSETGLYHSSAWFTKFHKKAKQSPLDDHIAKTQHEFARLLHTPVTVCTIDHLLIALTHSREDHHSITFNLAHSCVVIDEADFYDDFTQANIIELLKALSILKVPVMIMSASLPESSLKMYQSTGYFPKEIKEDVSDNTRIRCKIKAIRSYSNTTEIEVLLKKALKQPTIIYANTIASAMRFYNWFEQKNVQPILYHSRFTEPDKMAKEIALVESLGKEAWKQGRANGIAILTQIGEMSVNISADLMISELCPIDRLVQRVGRLSRFSETPGDLHLLIPQKDEALYPAPYGTYNRKVKRWEANKAFAATQKQIKRKGYSANDFVEFINKVYAAGYKFSDEAEANASKLRDEMLYNWLIVPNIQIAEDDDSTKFWKSRNIAAQKIVYVRPPGGDFENYKDFRQFENEYSVSCPTYLVKKAVEAGLIFSCPVTIRTSFRKQDTTIWVALTTAYNSELGLVLDASDFEHQSL